MLSWWRWRWWGLMMMAIARGDCKWKIIRRREKKKKYIYNEFLPKKRHNKIFNHHINDKKSNKRIVFCFRGSRQSRRDTSNGESRITQEEEAKMRRSTNVFVRAVMLLFSENWVRILYCWVPAALSPSIPYASNEQLEPIISYGNRGRVSKWKLERTITIDETCTYNLPIALPVESLAVVKKINNNNNFWISLATYSQFLFDLSSLPAISLLNSKRNS